MLPRIEGSVDAETASRFWHSAFDLLSVADVGSEGRFVRVNPRWSKVLGYSEDELLSRPCLDFVHPDDRTAAAAVLSDMAAGRTIAEPLEWRLRRADGTVLWTRWAGRYDPETGLLYSVARDITAEREARERLTFVQRLIERGVNAATVPEVVDGVLAEVATFADWIYGEAWVADDDVLRHHSAWCAFPELELYARRSADLVLRRGEGIPGVAWREDRILFGPETDDAASYPRLGWPEGEHFRGGVAFPVAAADRTVVFVFLDHREVLRDAETERLLQAVVEHTGTLIDRADALDQARRSRARLEAIINAIPASISVKDRAGRFVHVNEAYVADVGLEVSDLVGRRAADVLDPSVVEAAVRGDQEVLRRGEPFRLLERFETPDGPRHFKITKFPVHGPNGDVVATGSIAADVTDLREREREMAELHDELAERHRELEGFTITLSHDLRAPLRGIAHGAEEALTSPSPSKAAAHLERIRDEALTLARVLDDLLGYSWASRQPMDVVLTDVRGLVESLLERHQQEIEARKVHVTVGDLPAVHADETLLSLALDNLVTNALKFTRPVDGPRIAVTGRREDGEVVYSVVDNGVGVDPEHAAGLFEMFTRFHEDEFEGTGVGLSIVQRTATRHGGRTWVDAEMGEGAAFHLALPDGGSHA